MTHFSITLKQLRKQANLGQQELADILGVSKSAISMYEQGNREPNFSLLLQIADYFKVSANDLLGYYISPEEAAKITLAAHLDTSDLSPAELEDVEDYISYVRSKRKKKK